jgi:hypothetical protein
MAPNKCDRWLEKYGKQSLQHCVFLEKSKGKNQSMATVQNGAVPK